MRERGASPDVVGNDAVGHVNPIHVVLAHLARIRPHPCLALRSLHPPKLILQPITLNPTLLLCPGSTASNHRCGLITGQVRPGDITGAATALNKRYKEYGRAPDFRFLRRPSNKKYTTPQICCALHRQEIRPTEPLPLLALVPMIPLPLRDIQEVGAWEFF